MLDLWHRRANTPLEDFPMGPGDEVTVSVPEIEELQNQHARISQDGTVSLPLIGTVKVGGMDEDRARAAISQRLAKYMKVPRLEMYVERYRSRGVAVAGAVQKPGVYDLASLGDSLNDTIAMAGGLAPQAAEHALFLPVGVTRSDAAANQTQTSAVADERVLGAYSHTLSSRVSITLPFGRTGDVGCLNMPARPGDVILVPAAGTVTVVGWVRNPGSFPISPGMTVLGAVTAAGGALFSWHVEVLRTDQTGSRVVKRLSLSDLENGEETDIPVKAGDVLLVEKSVVGAVPYGLYQIFQHFGTGIGIPIP
jgi:polysaccharide export outer membrane protein